MNKWLIFLVGEFEIPGEKKLQVTVISRMTITWSGWLRLNVPFRDVEERRDRRQPDVQ